MGIQIRTRQINRVQIIDDNQAVRDAHKYIVEDSLLESVPVDSLFKRSINEFVQFVYNGTDAAICDHQLNKGQYASFNGAETVKLLYQRKFPAILCTRYEPHLDEIRIYRAHIPVVLPAEELNPDSLHSSFEQCLAEFDGEYTSSRKVWRALIRVDAIDEHYAHLIIPSWEPNSVVRLLKAYMPPKVVSAIENEVEYFHAWVNIGTEKSEELYFKDWELS